MSARGVDRAKAEQMVEDALALGLEPDEIIAILPRPIGSPRIMGVPIERVESITLNGRYWIEVLGTARHAIAADGSVIISFRIAQIPGGKNGKTKFGIGQGDDVSVPLDRIIGVLEKRTPGDVKVSSIG